MKSMMIDRDRHSKLYRTVTLLTITKSSYTRKKQTRMNRHVSFNIRCMLETFLTNAAFIWRFTYNPPRTNYSMSIE